MIEKSILIAILARDCNESLQNNIPKVESLRSQFQNSKVVVVENDSKDGTKETLQKWADISEGVHLIMNDFGTLTIPQVSSDNPHPSTSLHRIAKMARYRNMYMDYARSLSEKIDFLIIIDIDIEDFSVNGIVEAIIKAPENWGGLFANGSLCFLGHFPQYFDSFAYVPYNCGDDVARNFDEQFLDSKEITKRLRKKQFVECISAFGGLAIYKWDVIKSSNYEVKLNNRSKIFEALCEHIPLNLNITKKNYKNYICKDIKVDYGKRSWKEIIFSTIMPSYVSICFYKSKHR